jgi:aminoglycoside phosphotransferase (APT) family kinase protein
VADDELADRLASALGRRLGIERPVVAGLTRLSGGASRQTWSFELEEGDGPARPLILQRERGAAMDSLAGMSVEADLLLAAAAAGVKVPRVVATDGGEDDLGARFIVTDRVDGETIARKLLRDDEFAEARPLLARQAGEALAAIHSIDPTPFEGRLVLQDQVAQFRAVLDMLGEAHPAFELGFRWLERNAPDAGRPTSIVHGDFRNGNLIVGPDGLRAVLDWELAHLGDPVEDLGWFCVRAWRFGSSHRAGGFGPVSELLDGYRSASGVDVGLDELRWWEVMGTVRWGVICMVQANTHLSGASRSVELATIGRRTAENEHDVLQLIHGRGTKPKKRSEPEAQEPRPSASSAPHDRPTIAELIEAVREYLESEVMPSSAESSVRFHARVAVNALAMVERELALGPEQEAAHRTRLDALGFADDASLAAAIRAGELDDRWDEIVAAVTESVAAKLAVANPTYADGPA